MSGSANPVNVTMSAPRSVTANFSAVASITVTTNPVGRSITVDGTNFTAPQSFSWVVGSSHTIATTSPQGAGGTRYVFASWSDGGAQSHSVIAPGTATTYTASFTTQHLLTRAVTPAGGGTTSPSPSSGDGFYNSGTVVQITATANSGYTFNNWSGDASGSVNPVSVTMSAPRSVTANFSVTTAVGDASQRVFLLRQNAPNPFAGRTRITFSLARETNASLRIYDLRGRLVRTLVDSRLDPGARSVEWDGRDHAGNRCGDGIYLAVLRGEGRTQSRRLTLLR